MAQIENPYKELVDNHTTEEVLLFLEDLLAIAMARCRKGANDQNQNLLTLAGASTEQALALLKELNRRLNNLDDTPTIVA